MICLKESLKSTIVERLNSVWKTILLNKLDKNRNEVLFCINNSSSEIFSSSVYAEKSQNTKTDGNTMLLLQDVANQLKELKL